MIGTCDHVVCLPVLTPGQMATDFSGFGIRNICLGSSATVKLSFVLNLTCSLLKN